MGYAGHVTIQRGNLDAFAPQSDASFQAITHGQFPAPFLAQSSTLATPVNPDFMAVGRFTASGHNDLVIAAKGGSVLVVFAGDGRGNFARRDSQCAQQGGARRLSDRRRLQPESSESMEVGRELAIFNGGQIDWIR